MVLRLFLVCQIGQKPIDPKWDDLRSPRVNCWVLNSWWPRIVHILTNFNNWLHYRPDGEKCIILSLAGLRKKSVARTPLIKLTESRLKLNNSWFSWSFRLKLSAFFHLNHLFYCVFTPWDISARNFTHKLWAISRFQRPSCLPSSSGRELFKGLAYLMQ